MAKRVLLVEDEVMIALYASMALEDAGYEVVVAADGKQGLRAAGTEGPDAIVTDFMMPRLDGIAMLKALREEGTSIPALVVSAIPRRQLPTGSDEPFDAYLPKPYAENDLIRVLAELLEDPTDHKIASAR